VALRRRRHQHDEGAGRAADLEAAAAQEGDQEAADDGGIKPALRRRSGGDGNGHGKRQGNDRHRQPGGGVGAQVREPVTFAQDCDELRRIELGEARPGLRRGGAAGHAGFA
jgi:hypothetical protein